MEDQPSLLPAGSRTGAGMGVCPSATTLLCLPEADVMLPQANDVPAVNRTSAAAITNVRTDRLLFVSAPGKRA